MVDLSTTFKDTLTAVVIPLYENKDNKSDMNNYRGISVLSPICKLFEKVLAVQIID